MNDWKMDRKTLDILLKRLENLHKDLNYLQGVDPDDLLTSGMQEYRELMLIFISRVFIGLHDSLDAYMSTLKSPNKEGFLRKLDEEGESGFTRVLRNLGSSESSRGNHDLKDPYLEEFRRLNPEYQYNPTAGGYNSGQWVRPKTHSTTRKREQPANEVETNLLDSMRFDGLAAGFAIASDPANNVLTADDYYRRGYEGEPDPDADPPENVNVDCSVTQDDIADEIMDEFFADGGEDISLF